MKGITLLFVLVLNAGFSTYAQTYTASVKSYGPEHGLAHREVNAIFQDRRGFMWFGTQFGLSRFDGRTFTTYTKEKNGLAFDDIRSIAEDADGQLWLMGPYGKGAITLFNPLTGTAVSFEKKFKKPRPVIFEKIPHRIQNSDDGTVYFADYQPSRLISYHPKTGLREVILPQFKSLAIARVTPRNTIWAIADKTNLVELTPDGHLLHTFMHKTDVNICLGQANAGIDFYYFLLDSLGTRPVYGIQENGHRLEIPSFLASQQLFWPVCYALDRTGLMWNGTQLWSPAKGVILDLKNQLWHSPVVKRSFSCDRNGGIWLGTDFGIYHIRLTHNYFRRLFYREDQLTPVRGIAAHGDTLYTNLEKTGLFSSDLSGKSIKAPFGKVLFGSLNELAGKLYLPLGNDLLQYDPQTGKSSKWPLARPGTVWVVCPLPDRRQMLAGGQVGLWLVDVVRGRLLPYTQYNQFTELAEAQVLHIGADRQGTLWICATTGFYKVDPGKGVSARYWSEGTGAFKLPADSYQHFYQDRQGIFWLASANGGLIRWDSKRNQCRQFRQTEGLSNNNIYAVYADHRGHLWLSSDYGLMQFDPVRFTTRSYTVQDGITHNEFNRISHFQDKKGVIYFGGLNGITVFNPRDFENETSPGGLPLRVVALRQFDSERNRLVDKTEELVKTNQITLQPGDRFSVLEFALLNYVDAQQNVYAYQFKGLDNNWIYQNEASLRLGNLPYGEHELLIKAQAAGGRLSDTNLAIRISVLRPFYLRTWFLILMVALLLLAVWGWLRWRIWSHRQEQKRLETEIRQATTRIEEDKEIITQQARDLLRLNETRSRFFTNISHEFRTPLTVIIGMAAELKRTNSPEWVQRFGRITDLIGRNGNSLLRLINQILDLSKIEAGQMQLQLVRADLVRFCYYITESFQSIASGKAIQLNFQADEDTCELDFDKDKLQDILSNLLTNALKFTPTGGAVELQLLMLNRWNSLANQGFYEEVTPDRNLNSSWVQLRVSDNGPGIESRELPFIFDRFFRAEMPVGADAGGTGIGLALVKELVVLMNGGLAVRSIPGQGTEFRVSFAQTIQAPTASLVMNQSNLFSADPLEVAEAPVTDTADRPILLLVEDNEDVASYIYACVEADYQVLRAENGQQGIDLALEKIPSLILSDVMMPVKDGFELCHTLKTDERTSHIPIVLLTARAAVSDRLSGLQQGADAYLVKPFQREELLVVLNNLLQSRRVLQQYYSRLALETITSSPKTAVDQRAIELNSLAEGASLDDKFLYKLRSVIESRLDDAGLTIDQICHQMQMSRVTLHQKMMALTGMHLNRYIRSLRLRKAKSLLVTETMNVAEVAYAVGFSDPKYFSRVFSEEFGVSPVQFRQLPQN